MTEIAGEARVGQKPSKWVPFENPLTSLPETAQRILKAAIELLAERGYEAITLENVAGEAGVNKASIRYNFGNKAGLMAAVADALIHDECLRLAADVRSVPEDERLHVAMDGIRRMIVDADSFRGFFDILPHALRDPELRARLWSLYAWWYRQNLEWLGLADEPTTASRRHAHGPRRAHRGHPGRAVCAARPEPGRLRPQPSAATLEFLLRNSMQQLVDLAHGEAAPRPLTDFRAPAPTLTAAAHRLL